VAELETVIANLQEGLSTQEREANEVITGWQRSYDEISERCKALEEELVSAGQRHSNSLAELKTVVSNLNEQLESRATDESRVLELEAIVANLQQDLEIREREANETISGWQRSYNQVLETCQELEGKGATESNDLETAVSDLQRQLADKERELNEKIVEWENRLTELVEKCRYQEEQLTSRQEAFDAELSSRLQLEADIVDLQAKINDQLRQTKEATYKVTDLEAVVANLRHDLDRQQRETNDTNLVWQNKQSESETLKRELDHQVATLQGEVESLGKRLEQQEQEATSAIEQWEESYRRLESELNRQELPIEAHEELLSLQEKLENLTREANLLRENNAGLIAQKSQLQINAESLSEEFSSLRSEVEVLQRRLVEQEEEATNAISQWEESYQTLESEFNELKQVHEELVVTREKLNSVESAAAVLREENVALLKVNSQLELQLESWNAEKVEAREFSDAAQTMQIEVETLKLRLREQEEGAASTIARLEESCVLLESELRAIKLLPSPPGAAEELDELKDKLKRLQNDADLLRDNNATLFATKSNLESQVQLLKDSCVSLQDKVELVDQLRERVDEQDSEISKLIAQGSVLENDKYELELKLRATEDEKASIVGNLEKTLATLRLEIAEHDEHANEAINQWQESLSDAESRLESVQSEKNAVEGRIRDLEKMEAGLRKELAEHDELANEAISQWQESLSEAEIRVQTLESENSDLQGRIESLEAKLALSENELQHRHTGDDDATDTLSARCRQLEDELAFLEDQAETYEATIADRDRDLAELQRRVEVSDDQLASVREENHRLSSETRATETRLTVTRSEVESHAARLREAEKEHESTARELRGTRSHAAMFALFVAFRTPNHFVFRSN
jgi:chromosome segregation ATPase